jgi:hypothetical protein
LYQAQKLTIIGPNEEDGRKLNKFYATADIWVETRYFVFACGETHFKWIYATHIHSDQERCIRTKEFKQQVTYGTFTPDMR